MSLRNTVRISGFLLGIFGCCALLTTSAKANASGTYVARTFSQAFLLEIVQGRGDRILGHYEEVDLQPDGVLVTVNAQVAGAVDHGIVVLTIKPDSIFAPTLSVSGPISDNHLRLSGGGSGISIKIAMTRGTEGTFQSYVSDLESSSTRIRTAQAQERLQQQQAAMDQQNLKRLELIKEYMGEFGPLAASRERYLAFAEKKYREITAVMESLYIRERAIFAGYQTVADRSQLWVSIDQYFIASENIHIAVENHLRAFKAFQVKIAVQIRKAEASCHAIQTHSVAVEEAGGKSLGSACSRLFASLPQFIRSMHKLQASYQDIGAIWTTERLRQHRILNAAQIAVEE